MGSRSKRVHWLWLVSPPLLCALGAAAVLWSDAKDGLRPLLSLRAQVERTAGRVDALEAERTRLVREIRGLRGDDFAVEAAARRSLGMVRPGEVVVRLDESER